MRKTGILGGTFNPIHLAHLAMAEAALQQAELEEIWFMPSKKPPHKSHREIISEEHRSRMIQLAIQGNPAYRFSDYELKRRGMTYTAETLQGLQKDYPEHRFYFIMGGDSFFQLENWYCPELIMKSCCILAVSRNGASWTSMQEQADSLRKCYGAKIQLLQMEELPISSSQIRHRIGVGETAEDLLPEAVSKYIQCHQLYT